MQTVDVKQATQRLSELIELTINGDDIVITKGGQPVVKLVAVKKPKKRRQFGSSFLWFILDSKKLGMLMSFGNVV